MKYENVTHKLSYPDIDDLNKELKQLTIHSTIVSQRIDFLRKELWLLSSIHNLTNDIFPIFPQLGQIVQITNHKSFEKQGWYNRHRY